MWINGRKVHALAMEVRTGLGRFSLYCFFGSFFCTYGRWLQDRTSAPVSICSGSLFGVQAGGCQGSLSKIFVQRETKSKVADVNLCDLLYASFEMCSRHISSKTTSSCRLFGVPSVQASGQKRVMLMKAVRRRPAGLSWFIINYLHNIMIEVHGCLPDTINSEVIRASTEFFPSTGKTLSRPGCRCCFDPATLARTCSCQTPPE